MRTARFWLSIVVLVSMADGANILINSSFEDWFLGMPLGWLTSELTSPGSALQDSASHTGAFCVKLTGLDTAAYITSGAVVQPGRSYYFSGFVRSPGVVGGSFVFQFAQLTGTPVGSPILVPAYYSGADYREYTQWLYAPDSAALISVSFATLTGLTAYVDDVTLNDSTASGIEEQPVTTPVRQRPALRKIVMMGGGALRGHSEVLFDPAGRRVFGARPGVYFRLER